MAQTCPPYAVAKQQMKAHQGLADPKPAPFEFLLYSPGLPSPIGIGPGPLWQALVGLGFA